MISLSQIVCSSVLGPRLKEPFLDRPSLYWRRTLWFTHKLALIKLLSEYGISYISLHFLGPNKSQGQVKCQQSKGSLPIGGMGQLERDGEYFEQMMQFAALANILLLCANFLTNFLTSQSFQTHCKMMMMMIPVLLIRKK